MRLTRRAAFALPIALAAFTGVARAADALPAQPEPGKFKLGLEPWLGYGQWQIAQEKGFFTKHDLQGVDLVNFTEDKDINSALASGQLDGANVATHTAMAMAAAGLPIKIVMLLDFSNSADAILAGPDIADVKALKGKQIAFEEGTTSDILLNYALGTVGMTIADIQKVPMPAADAGSALIAGRVPVAVTYEPYISAARKQNPKMRLLFTAGTDPGLVSDVLVVREDVLNARPGQVLALVRSWGDALDYYRAHTDEGRAIIAKSVGSSLDDLRTAFDGVTYYSVEENRGALLGSFAQKTFADVMAAATKAGILTKPVSADAMIDPRFVQAAQGG